MAPSSGRSYFVPHLIYNSNLIYNLLWLIYIFHVLKLDKILCLAQTHFCLITFIGAASSSHPSFLFRIMICYCCSFSQLFIYCTHFSILIFSLFQLIYGYSAPSTHENGFFLHHHNINHNCLLVCLFILFCCCCRHSTFTLSTWTKDTEDKDDDEATGEK